MKRSLIICLLGFASLLFCGNRVANKLASAAPVSVSDNFTRANDATGLGANWTQQQTSPVIPVLDNYAKMGAQGIAGAYWSANSFRPQQFSSVQLAFSVAASHMVAPTVRVSGTAGAINGYSACCDGTSCLIQRIDSGTPTTLKTVTVAFAGWDFIKIGVSGSTISIYKNGTFVDSTTDSTYATGNAGIWYHTYSGDTAIGGGWTGGEY